LHYTSEFYDLELNTLILYTTIPYKISTTMHPKKSKKLNYTRGQNIQRHLEFMPLPRPILTNKTLYSRKQQQKKREKREHQHYDLLLKALYMLVEIAIALVTTASIIITSAIILSFLVDMPRASLSLLQIKKIRSMTNSFL
jgi:hypothetical protein